jgi:hypothetical protein
MFPRNTHPTGGGPARARWLGRNRLVAVSAALAAVGAGIVAIVVSVVPVTNCATPPASVSPPSGVTDAYDRQVLSFSPALYLTFAHPSSATEADLSGNSHAATYLPASNPPGQATLPNGDVAASFNGQSQYAQVPSSDALSITHTGCLTVEAWIRAATKQFPREEGTGYVYILGKGTTNQYEYATRMYSAVNTETPVRPNRISGYVWNLSGGLGSGAYFQDKGVVGVWIMVTMVVDAQKTSSWPNGYVALYKNGVLRGKVSLNQYDVKPQASSAPFCIGTRNLDSYFDGAIGKVAVYDSALPQSDIAATYNAMVSPKT